MPALQYRGLTGRKYPISRVPSINAMSQYLPEIYEQRSEEAYRQSLIDLEETKLEQAKTESALNKEAAEKAGDIAEAGLFTSGGLGLISAAPTIGKYIGKGYDFIKGLVSPAAAETAIAGTETLTGLGSLAGAETFAGAGLEAGGLAAGAGAGLGAGAAAGGVAFDVAEAGIASELAATGGGSALTGALGTVPYFAALSLPFILGPQIEKWLGMGDDKPSFDPVAELQYYYQTGQINPNSPYLAGQPVDIGLRAITNGLASMLGSSLGYTVYEQEAGDRPITTTDVEFPANQKDELYKIVEAAIAGRGFPSLSPEDVEHIMGMEKPEWQQEQNPLYEGD